MKVEKTIETKEYLVYSTETHDYRIAEDKLDKIKDEKSKLLNSIQKGMKQTKDFINGEEFDSSWRAIYKEITGHEV